MKYLLKNNKILVAISIIISMITLMSMLPAYGLVDNSENSEELKTSQPEHTEVNSWEPYSSSEKFNDIFVFDPSNLRTIDVSEVSSETAEEILVQASARCGDQYGYTGWSSLGAAQSYYGFDFSYFLIIPFFFNGGRYTHYYYFSNGSKMYFGVNP